MIKDRISIICAALAATIAVQIDKYLIVQKIDPLISLIVSVTVATLIQWLLIILIVEIPLRSRTIRHLLNPISRIEGYWFESINSFENPFSYGCVEYNQDTKEYLYYGSNFNRNLDLYASFRSTNVQVIKELNTIHFHFQATKHRVANSGDSLTGYGNITFLSDRRNTFNRAEGRFFDDYGDNIQSRRLLMTRIPDKIIAKILKSKNNIENYEDIKMIICKMLDENPSLRKWAFNSEEISPS